MNILINSACNGTCKFCFEPKSFKDMAPMELSMFTDIVDWHIHSYQNDNNIPISILGGEPTLHENLSGMLNYILEKRQNGRNINTLLITNGAFIEKYTDQLANIGASVLLNCSALPSNEIVDKINALHEKNIGVTPSFTILGQSEKEKLDLVFSTFNHYKIPTVRIASAAKCDAESGYYEEIKPYLLEGYELATRANRRITTDCSKIPLCFFTNEEMAKLKAYSIERTSDDYLAAKCACIADVLPNGKVIRCMPLYQDNPEYSYFDFNNCSEVYTYTSEKIGLSARVAKFAGAKECLVCDKYKKAQCSGGCLGMNIVR